MDAHNATPYGVSKKIRLLIDGTHPVRATILHTYEPFNSSCTMNILFDTDLSFLGIQGKVVLKLFDRRHAAGLRLASGAIPWSPALETRYARMIMDGTPAVVQSHLIKRLKAFDSNPEDPRPMDRVAHENCFQVFCEVAFCAKMRTLFEKEVEAYTLLQALQGTVVPRLIAKVTVIEQPEFPRPTNPQCLEVPGLIFQYRDGFPLAEFPRHTPMKLWPAIVDETTRTVCKIMDCGILLHELCPDKVLVKLGDGPGLRIEICFLDFSKCKLLRDFESEEEMRHAQVTYFQDLQPVFTYTLH